MTRQSKTLLLTGTPGVGKTTIIRRVGEALHDRKIRGFVTDEIREQGERVGFRLDTFDGQGAILAHVKTKSPHRVGKYGVDVVAVDRIVHSALHLDDDVDIYLIDEIGKMECFSQRFIDAMTVLLDSSQTVIATIALKGPGLIQRVKDRPDVELWQITRQSRDEMPGRVVRWVEMAG